LVIKVVGCRGVRGGAEERGSGGAEGAEGAGEAEGAEELKKKRELIMFGYKAQEISPKISPHPV